MKYSVKIVAALVLLFFLAQLVGLALLYAEIQVVPTPTGPSIVHEEPVIGPRPELQGIDSLIYILTGVLIGTGLLFVIIRFQKVNVWKAFFFFAVFISISVSLGVIFAPEVAFLFGLILAALKLFKRNILIHNLTELLIYAGLAIIFVPLFDPVWAAVLLLAISVYDAFAVWKSRHMITLAKFQTGSKVFAGLFITYGEDGRRGQGGSAARPARSAPALAARTAASPNHPMGMASAARRKHPVQEGRYAQPAGEAVLGGGDIAFPLVFAGTVMSWLVTGAHLTKEVAFAKAVAIPVIAAVVLTLLLLHGKPGRFYPAMPFLTLGCLAGFAMILLI